MASVEGNNGRQNEVARSEGRKSGRRGKAEATSSEGSESEVEEKRRKRKTSELIDEGELVLDVG